MIYAVIIILNLISTFFTLDDASSTIGLIIQILFRSGATSVFMCAVVYYLKEILNKLEERDSDK